MGYVYNPLVTVSADAAPNVYEGTGESMAEITIMENMAYAFPNGGKIYLELPSTNFAFETATATGLRIDVEPRKLIVTRTATDTVAKTFTITDARITVFPGAPGGDVLVEVSGSSGSNVEANSIVVARVEVPDRVAPHTPSNFSVDNVGTHINIAWINPVDDDFAATRMLEKPEDIRQINLMEEYYMRERALQLSIRM